MASAYWNVLRQDDCAAAASRAAPVTAAHTPQREVARKTIKAAVECKKWNRALSRDDVKGIIDDYKSALELKEIHELWIICDQTSAAGAREYVKAFDFAK